MTQTTADAVTGSVEWTQQGRRLWVGRCDGTPVGTIEQGRRFVYLDTDGVPVRAFSSFDEAVGVSSARGSHVATLEDDRLVLLVTALAALVMTGLFVLTAAVVL